MNAASVICPFYKYHLERSVTCEGPVEGTTITWQWQNRNALNEQMRIFCCKHCERCEVHRCVTANRDFSR